jgi:hypothetical protein
MGFMFWIILQHVAQLFKIKIKLASVRIWTKTLYLAANASPNWATIMSTLDKHYI